MSGTTALSEPATTHDAMKRRPGRSADLAWGVAAAVPTLAYTLIGHPSLTGDDWHFALLARTRGWQMYRGIEPARALNIAWETIAFNVWHTHIVPQLLVLALLNGVLAVLIWRVAVRLASVATAVAVTATWVLLPNRASTRLWVSTIPIVIACILVVVTLLVALGKGRRPETRVAIVTALGVASVLCYEASIVPALAVLLFAVRDVEPVGRRVRASAIALGALAITLLWNVTHSPKVDGVAHQGRMDTVESFLHASFGRAIVPASIAPVVVAVVVAVVLWAVATVVLPSFGRDPDGDRLVAGAIAFVVGGAVLIAAGFPVADNGLFDRPNIWTGLGAATIWGALVVALARRGPAGRVAGGLAAILLVAAGIAGNVSDVRHWSRAARDGRALLRATDALDDGTLRQRGVSIVGVSWDGDIAAFDARSDFGAAVALRRRFDESPPVYAVLASSQKPPQPRLDFCFDGMTLRPSPPAQCVPYIDAYDAAHAARK